jgi:hypothetical protein
MMSEICMPKLGTRVRGQLVSDGCSSKASASERH